MQDFTLGIQQSSYDKAFYVNLLEICENQQYDSIEGLFKTLN